ncbi:MAG: XdhC family protein [Myxococcales bacterium]|nr:XdhC family protein [Myxococcales bacterium]MCB9750385.1 XdhC family protein [Myxococcales bacterium]
MTSSSPPPDEARSRDGANTVFEAMDAGGHLEVLEAASAVLRAGRRAALATVIGRAGSAPQVVGARLLLHEDGVLVGTVGGGAIEAQVLEACRASLADSRSRRIHAHLVRDLGMCCGGSMEVFVECLQGAPRLFLVGAGRVAAAVIEFARAIGFRVLVVEGREERLRDPPFAGAETLRCDEDFRSILAALPPPGDQDYFLIATGDHGADERALVELLPRAHRLVGMLGSRRKVARALQQLDARDDEARARGLEPVDRSRLRAPVGLALGGRTPGEIAISVLAELIATRRGGRGGSMNVIDDAVARFSGPPARDPGPGET